MPANFEAKKQEIINALNTRNIQCGSCHAQKQFLTLVDGFINQPLQKELTGSLIIGGPSIPLIALVCMQCGHVQFYAIKALIPNIEL